MANQTISEKANRILNGILIVLLLITFRIWLLATVQHETKVEESRKPQIREIVERAERATISDRFGVPLAMNKVQYNATICYSQIRKLPLWVWKKEAGGGRSKQYPRKAYITALSQKLANELSLDAQNLEDRIHSKAAILGNVPYVIQEDIPETTYFRLKMLEKDWPGLCADITAKRSYPLGPVAGEIIGYLGPMSQSQYDAITEELEELEASIQAWEEGDPLPFPKGYYTIEAVKKRRHQLEKVAYTLNDPIGKLGVERTYDELLRGVRGKHLYLSDIKGNWIRELPGSETSTPGQHITLTLSSELQQYAEQLLAEYNQEPPSARASSVQKKALIPENKPWIKGGAIVVMDPHNGEIYAMASFPRFDPNDFIRTGDARELAARQARIHQWLESETFAARVWDLQYPLTRERYDPLSGLFYEELLELTWDHYLRFILPPSSPVRELLTRKGTVYDAVYIQVVLNELLELFPATLPSITPQKIIDSLYTREGDVLSGATITLPEHAYLEEQKELHKEELKQLSLALAPYLDSLPLNKDKLLLIDLYRIVVEGRAFSAELLRAVGAFSLQTYREASALLVSAEEVVRERVQQVYHTHDFATWRTTHFKPFLAEKRAEEKQVKIKHPRPYTDYLDEAERTLFRQFWEAHRWDFLTYFLTGAAALSSAEHAPYLETIAQLAIQSTAEEPERPALFHCQRLRKLITPLAHTPLLIPFFHSMRRFADLDRPLWGRYPHLRGPLEKDLATAFYPTYGFGFARSYAFRQATVVGSIFKLVPAYEALRQRYLQNSGELNPLTIIDDTHRAWGREGLWNVGYLLDGKTIPSYYHGGRVPRSEHSGIGQVDLVQALSRSSNPYFSLLAGDVLEDPEDICHAAALLGYGSKTGIDLPGEYAGHIPQDTAYNRSGLYAMAIGQHTMIGTPLQTTLLLASIANGGTLLKPLITRAEPTVRWNIFLPAPVQRLLVRGMQQVIMGEKGTAHLLQKQFPYELVGRLIGKTSTADILEACSLDGAASMVPSKEIWFGAIAYKDFELSQPELVVVVYLKHGDFGKHAAPLAAKIIQKWHAILANHS